MKKVFLFFAMVLVFISCSAQLTEEVVETYSNGKPLVVRYLNRKGDCVKEAHFYSTGQLKMEGGMKGEKREGEWKSYFPDGRMQSIGTFVNGLRTGEAKVWQVNGNLLQEGFYKGDTHVGKWKFYDEQGNLKNEVDFGTGE